MIIERNVYWAPNQHITMISEWPCDTEGCEVKADENINITEINTYENILK